MTSSLDTEPEPPLGPLPARGVPAPTGLGRTCLTAVVEHPGVTVAEVQRVIGGHANTARNHLEALAEAGLVVARPVANGPGRPSLRYTATPAGLAVASDASQTTEAEALTELVTVLAEAVAAGTDRDVARRRAHELGESWGHRLAPVGGTPEQVRAGLRTRLAAEGFAPVERGDRLDLLRCPFLGAARENPDVICMLHAGMISAVTADDDGHPGARLVPFAAPGTCQVQVTGRGAGYPHDHD